MTNGSGLTAGDILALTKNENEGFLEGNGIIILILFFLIFGFGGNGFGGGGNGLTQSELQTGLYNQTTDRNLADIRTAQCATDNLINTTAYNNAMATANAKYENLSQFKDLMASNQACCCDLKTTIIEQNQATRNMINQHYIDELSDKLSVTRSELSNLKQNEYLISTFGRVVTNPSVPYCSGCVGNTLI